MNHLARARAAWDNRRAMPSTKSHLLAALAGAAPVLYALEGAPGTAGKVACAVVAVLVALGLLRATSPVAPKADQ